MANKYEDMLNFNRCELKPQCDTTTHLPEWPK